MNRNLFIVLITAAGLIWVPFLRAADQTITCTDSGCSGIADALFNESGVAPGESLTKSLEIVNNHAQTLKLALSSVSNAATDDDLLQWVTVTVTTDKGSRFTGTLGQFLTAYIDLEKLESHQRRPVAISLSLADVGNDFQGKKATFSFDLKINQEIAGDSPDPAGGIATEASFSPLLSPGPVGLLAGVLSSQTPEGTVAGQGSFSWWRPILFLLLPLPLFWYWRFRKMR